MTDSAGWRPATFDPFSGACGLGDPNTLVGAMLQAPPALVGHPRLELHLVARAIAEARPGGHKYLAAVTITGPGDLNFLAVDPAGEAFETPEEALEMAEAYRDHLLARPSCLGRLVLGPVLGD